MKKILLLIAGIMLVSLQAANTSGTFVETSNQETLCFDIVQKSEMNLNVNTNMKKISDICIDTDTDYLKAIDGSRSLKNLVGEGESFEEAYPPAGWSIANVDGGGKTWQRFVTNSSIPAHTGSKGAAHLVGMNGYEETGLLITPPLAIENEATENKLTFWETGIYQYDSFYHGIMVSTTDNLPTSFTELSKIPEASEVPVWKSTTVDLQAYKGKTIYLAFKYSGTYADTWLIDDAKVTGAHFTTVEDTSHPIANIPSGTTAGINNTLTIQTIVSDATGIGSVTGKYKLAGQNEWTEFPMTSSKIVSGTYTGSIPAQSQATSGVVKFTMTDTVSPANTGDSPETPINWVVEPDTKWIEWGTEYDTATGLACTNSSWWCGIDYDFGTTTQWRLTKVKIAVEKPADLPWNVRLVSKINENKIRLGDTIASGIINCKGLNDTIPTISDVADTTILLSGYVAIVFDMPAGVHVTRDVEAPSQHTFIEVNDTGTLSVLPSMFTSFKGAWYAGIYVSQKNVGIEDIQILPGRSELSQNYPNPFNPTTSIRFYNNMSGKVRLSVLNAKGETVSTLINSSIAAGNHEISFNASSLNSGIYFYKLETPTATLTKKMVLVK